MLKLYTIFGIYEKATHKLVSFNCFDTLYD